MDRRRFSLTSSIVFGMTLAFILVPACISVTSAHSVEVQNNSDKPLVIFARHDYDGKWGDTYNCGQVTPGKKLFLFSMVQPDSKSNGGIHQVEARNLNGKLVKSWEFPFQDRILLVVESTDASKQ